MEQQRDMWPLTMTTDRLVNVECSPLPFILVMRLHTYRIARSMANVVNSHSYRINLWMVDVAYEYLHRVKLANVNCRSSPFMSVNFQMINTIHLTFTAYCRYMLVVHVNVLRITPYVNPTLSISIYARPLAMWFI